MKSTIEKIYEITKASGALRKAINDNRYFAQANAAKASRQMIKLAHKLTPAEVLEELEKWEGEYQAASPALEALAWLHGGAFRVHENEIIGCGTYSPDTLSSEYFGEEGHPITYTAKLGCWRDESGSECSENADHLSILF